MLTSMNSLKKTLFASKRYSMADLTKHGVISRKAELNYPSILRPISGLRMD